MKIFALFILIVYSNTLMGYLTVSREFDFETRRIDMIVNIIKTNLKNNGWHTILCFGKLPDQFYTKLQIMSYPFAITNINREDDELEDVVRYYANIIIISLEDIKQYEETILKLMNFPYWHPHSNIILYYHQENYEILAKLFFSLWYYKAINAIIVQYDDTQEVLLVSRYSPYISEGYKLDRLYGCWTTRKIGMPVSGFETGFTCEEKCHNVSLHSKLRGNNLGTCIGFSTIVLPYNTSHAPFLFDDKSKNLHGFTFRAYTTEVQPFLLIDDNGNGSYTLRNRDGIIWNSMSKLINFTIDLTPSVNVMFEHFNFELNIQQIFDFSRRKGDLFLIPIYLFDLIIVDIDHTVPIKESGVCIMSHRAGFDTKFFDAKTLHAHRSTIAQSILCFLGIWLTYSIFQCVEKRCLSIDQLGKDLLNAIRNVLLVTLYNPPRLPSFRIFLTISIWSCFVINFASQAIIISHLTAVKRGKEVDTFEDVIEKGYLIYSMASPDLILPDTEEKFRTINSRLMPEQDLFACVRHIPRDSERFCLIDCAVGRYLERNKLNQKGEQYLHVARQDRMHSHYLSMIFEKYSPLTERFNRFMTTFYEAGLIKKWEQYRYAHIKEEAPARPLGMDDYEHLFDIYCLSVGFIFIIFVIELIIFHVKRLLKYCLNRKYKRR